MPANKESTPVSCAKKRKAIEPRSWVWLSNYATKLNANSAKCNLCTPPITLILIRIFWTRTFANLKKSCKLIKIILVEKIIINKNT
ncbi:hypothetical protein BpHYR1_048333 [Brachionus plicatilis]|uniref:Uncharacterized protein n=1 Tax=Brachionus plicatilis TaxID=10195 RepID=A0A3M7PEZ0_BRAPC|nr:hypothetical protein BpHYR1_048333 [Brachionus plicatilis]